MLQEAATSLSTHRHFRPMRSAHLRGLLTVGKRLLTYSFGVARCETPILHAAQYLFVWTWAERVFDWIRGGELSL
jgi:hypothetical protein